jgi:hypothetical protein
MGAAGRRDFRRFDLVVKRPLEFFYNLHRLNDPDGPQSLLRDYAPDILRIVAPKVLARSEAVQTVVQGFHDIRPKEAVARHREIEGYVGHFQARNLAQFSNKARLVADYIAANPPEDDPAPSRHWVRLAALHRAGLIDEEFARQVLSEAEIAERLKEGVIERDGRIAARLAMLAHANTAAAADG